MKHLKSLILIALFVVCCSGPTIGPCEFEWEGYTDTDTYSDSDTASETQSDEQEDIPASELLNGKTATFIPNSHNSGFVDPEGEPLVISTRIHNVRFCVGDRRTDELGGISEYIEPPLEKNRNGVEYFEENLLLSGVGFHGEDNLGDNTVIRLQ